MHKPVILLVEDEEHVVKFNQDYLTAKGYQVYAARTLSQARFALEENPPDLILLDVMLPDGYGWDFCKELRRSYSTPVIYLTCRGEEESIVKGLSSGGDDYILKPYSLPVLEARISTVLRRKSSGTTGCISYPPLRLDLLKQTAFLNNEPLHLPQKSFQILCCMVSNPGQRIPLSSIKAAGWGDVNGVSDNAATVAVSRLRSQLGLDEDSVFELICTADKEYVFRKVRF